MQTIERKGKVLYLRVDLINTPSVINSPRHLVFGLQASPTKPMPEGWRANRNTPPPHGGPVVCWDGYFLPLNTWNNASLDMEWRWYDEQKYTWGDAPNPIPFPAAFAAR